MFVDAHATLLLWRWRPMLICKLLPPDGAGRADTEPYRSLPTQHHSRSPPQLYPEDLPTMLAPVMPASCTSRNPESENRSDGNSLMIQHGEKPL